VQAVLVVPPRSTQPAWFAALEQLFEPSTTVAGYISRRLYFRRVVIEGKFTTSGQVSSSPGKYQAQAGFDLDGQVKLKHPSLLTISQHRNALLRSLSLRRDTERAMPGSSATFPILSDRAFSF
jgi:hypothetical protein